MMQIRSGVCALGAIVLLGGFAWCADGYDPVEYVEATGNQSGLQYVDTGYMAGPNSRFEADFQFCPVGGTINDACKQWRVFGSADSKSNRPFHCIVYINGEKRWGYSCNDDKVSSQNTGVAVDAERDILVMDVKADTLTVRNKATGKVTVNVTMAGTATKTATDPIYIFSSNEPGVLSNENYWSRIRIYGFRILEDGEVIHDYVPVVRHSDGVAGLYDIADGVSERFLPSSTATPLVAGPRCNWMRIAGSPVEIGSPSPSYGVCSGLEPGDTIPATCPSAAANAEDTIRGTCTGWTLVEFDGTTTEGSGTSKTIVYDDGLGSATLTWNWDASYAVDMRPVVDATPVGNVRHWPDADGKVVLTRPEAPGGCEFAGWYGPGIAEAHRLDETLTLTPTAPVAVYALFRTAGSSSSVYFVDDSAGVDDASRDGHSPEAAWKTLGFAVSEAEANSTVVLAKGTHVVLSAVDVNKPLTIRGDGENWETVLTATRQNARLTLSADGVLLHNVTLSFNPANTVPQAIYMTGDSTVSNVVVRDSSDLPIRAKKGLFTHCWITNNIASSSCAGMYLEGSAEGSACVRNSYFARNVGANNTRGARYSGVLTLSLNANVRAESCTIVDNVLYSGVAALKCDGACTVRNCLVWNNVSDEDRVANLSIASNDGLALVGNCTTPTNGLNGAGNIEADPKLKADRMHVGETSPCRGAAIAEYAPPTDLDGRPRGEHPTIGAFEYFDDGGLSVTVESSAKFVRQPEGIELTAAVTGDYRAPLSYAWDFTGDGGIDSTDPSPTLTEPGLYRPALRVTDADGKGATDAFGETLVVHEAGSSTYYVSDETGSNDNTGLDPARPKKTLSAAISSELVTAGDVIELAKGVHRPADITTVDKAVVVRGAGRPEETVIDGQDAKRYLEVTAAGATVCNLTLYRTGSTGGKPMAIKLAADSVVSNVVMHGNNADKGPELAGQASTVVQMTDGLLTHCVITNNRAWNNAGVEIGGSARMENCLLADNWNMANTMYGSGFESGIVVIRGEGQPMRNCTVVGNRAYKTAAVRLHSGFSQSYQPVVANNVIWGNLEADWGSVEQPTGVVSNWDAVSLLSLTAEQMTANMIANCTWPTNRLTGAKNLEADPLLSAKQPYHITTVSPCRNAGDDAQMAGSHDLDGEPRKKGRHVDIGCYEVDGPGMVLLVK